jgi:hypothetical protein
VTTHQAIGPHAGPTTVAVTIDQGALHALLTSPHGPAGQWMTRLVNRAVNNAKRGARVDTGYNRSRIEGRVTVDGHGIAGELVGRTAYAKYVEDGTQHMGGDHNLKSAAAEALRGH